MTTALDRLRGFAAAARRDCTISGAEADILDRLVRVAEDEAYGDDAGGALEELADNLRRALDRCVERDDADDIPDTVVTVDADDIPDTVVTVDADDIPDTVVTVDADDIPDTVVTVDADDIPSTGCPTCDAVLDTLDDCHGMSLRGTTAAEVAESARDWIGDLLVDRDRLHAEVDDVRAMLDAETRQHAETSRELDAAHAEVERLRAEVASLRERVGEPAPDTAEPDDGWEPGPWWSKDEDGDDVVMHNDTDHAALVMKASDRYSAAAWYPGRAYGVQTFHPTRRAAMRWCEAQPEMADVIAAHNSAPTVGATDAGPDAPALIVEGDDGTGAREARAVPAAPVSGAEQSCGETGVDRPRDDERIVGPREGEDWIGMGKHAGTSPYGYDVDTSGDDPVLVTNQVEADTMLLLCEWRDAGVSAQTMAKRLNDIGRRTRSGCAWSASSVRSRLLSSGSGYDEWHEVGR